MNNSKKIIVLLAIAALISAFTLGNDKGNQRALYECTEPMDIDSTLFTPEPGKLYFHFDRDRQPENLRSKGFLWLEDNPKGYFTAYLINTTDESFSATRQDRSLIMIQEAMDENGKWKPIEYWVRSGCGNSYFNPLKLDPGKYVMIPVKKYEGDFNTKFRLKMKNDKTIFYSDPFEGSMDKKQFEKETDDVNGILYTGPASYLD